VSKICSVWGEFVKECFFWCYISDSAVGILVVQLLSGIFKILHKLYDSRTHNAAVPDSFGDGGPPRLSFSRAVR
jgi:hypothetical protein